MPSSFTSSPVGWGGGGGARGAWVRVARRGAGAPAARPATPRRMRRGRGSGRPPPRGGGGGGRGGGGGGEGGGEGGGGGGGEGGGGGGGGVWGGGGGRGGGRKGGGKNGFVGLRPFTPPPLPVLDNQGDITVPKPSGEEGGVWGRAEGGVETGVRGRQGRGSGRPGRDSVSRGLCPHTQAVSNAPIRGPE